MRLGTACTAPCLAPVVSLGQPELTVHGDPAFARLDGVVPATEEDFGEEINLCGEMVQKSGLRNTDSVGDLLHRGHVTYLAQARALGASLIVALNTDASARRLGKGPDRPLNNEADRACVLAALETELDPGEFFRLNRNYLVRAAAVRSFSSVGKGRLSVQLTPRASEEVIVSQERGAEFRTWAGA